MPELQAVVAGSQAFVDALDAHLRLRLGAAPLLARNPAQAMLACMGDGGLLVLEYAGPDWLEAVKSLRTVRDSAALPIVAAVPSSCVAELADLKRAGVDETVRWDARVDPVLWAVDRVISARPRRVAPAGRATDAGCAPAPALAGEAVFDIREVEPAGLQDPVDLVAPLPPPAAASAGEVTPPPPSPGRAATSPLPGLGQLPSREAVEEILRAALAGDAGGIEALRAVTRRVVPDLTELERSAVEAAALPFDGAPIRAAAALRWRIAAVLEHARSSSGGLRDDAVRALPAEIDAALGKLKSLADAGPAEMQGRLEAVRNALVKDAIALTGALTAALDLPAAPQVDAPRKPPAPVTRVTFEAAPEPASGKRRWILPAFFVLALAGAVVYNAGRLHGAGAPGLPTVVTAPSGTTGVVMPDGSKVVMPNAGRKPTAEDVERFKADEALKGNEVQDLGGGTLVVTPRSARPSTASQQAARGGRQP